LANRHGAAPVDPLAELGLCRSDRGQQQDRIAGRWQNP
jgi:hypothetical protein